MGKIGYGGKFLIGDGVPAGCPPVEGFDEVAKVISIGGPSMARDSVDDTGFDSPDGYREFILGLKDGGEVSVEFKVKDTTQLDLLTVQLDEDEPGNYKIEWPFSPVITWTFKAGMTGLEFEAPMEDGISGTATFKISGKPTVA